MIKLQTTITVQQERDPIDYGSEVLLLGSCFVAHIGGKLDYYKFKTTINPFGIIFHPVAIERLVTRAINEEEFTEKDVFYHNEQWHCFDAHSTLSALKKEEFLCVLNDRLTLLKASIERATHIVLTVGTAWVYRHIASNEIVANCHKVPQKKFLKELLSVEAVTESIDKTVTLLKAENPSVKIITTVSPVRHLKDGFVENTLSKAHLISGVHQVVDPRQAIYYFPSYELMMDELRDYRYYTTDLLHPNTTATQLIWERFTKAWIASETEKTRKEVSSIQNGLRHKPFNPESEAHQIFLKQLAQQIEQLQRQYPHMQF